RRLWIAHRHPGRDPGAEGFVFRAAARNADTAAVGDGTGGLGQQQAQVRDRRQHAPTPRLLYQGGVVGGRGGSEDGELEAVLPLRLAVAPGGVAAKSAQKWNDVILEMQMPHLCSACHAHWYGALVAARGDDHFGRSVTSPGYDARRTDDCNGWLRG